MGAEGREPFLIQPGVFDWQRIVHVAASMFSSLAITQSRLVYTWGFGTGLG